MPEIDAITQTTNIGWSNSTQLKPNGSGGLIVRTFDEIDNFTISENGIITTRPPAGRTEKITIDSFTNNNMGTIFADRSLSIGCGSGWNLRLEAAGGLITFATGGLAADETSIACDADHQLAIRSSTVAQSFAVYNTYTNSSNYERARLYWNSNQMILASEAAGTGTQRPLILSSATIQTDDGVRQIRFNSGNIIPLTTNGSSLGGSSNYWSNIYSRDYYASRYIYRSITAGITASTTQTQGQQPLTTEINQISTVANANDTVTMPSAVPGMRVTIINNGSNTLRVYPASGDNLGGGVNAAFFMSAGSNREFLAYDTTNWTIV